MNSTATRDVLIHRATVHVVRRGGWSWGPSPQSVVRAVQRALPTLLSHIIERDALASIEDADFTAPVMIRVPMRLADLCELAANGATDDSSGMDEAIAGAVAHMSLVGNGSRMAAGGPMGELERSRTRSADSDRHQADEAATENTPDRSARVLLAMLRRWEREAELVQRCSALPPELLLQWIEHVRALWPSTNIGAEPQPTDAELEEAFAQVQQERVLLPPGEQATLVRQVILAARLFAMGASRSQAQHLLGSLKPKELACEPEASQFGADAQPDAAIEPSLSPPLSVKRRLTSRLIRPQNAASHDFEFDIPSALPFLLLGPLSKIGYLDALQVASSVAGGGRYSPALAAALAYKVLQAPQRGWYREAPQRLAAAVFAGQPELVDDEEIAAAARALSGHAPLFDQVIAANLLAGHRAEAPWLLCADERADCILFDADGLFPVATGSPQRLATAAAPSGSPLYVARSAATVDRVFQVLDDLQIPYVALASAGSSAPRVSSHGPHQGRMRALAEHGDTLCERAIAAWHAIRFERPLARHLAQPAIEASLALAASFALAQIAWTLWRADRSTDPLVALQRLGDLDASVRVNAAAVHVRLPLGRRFWELRDHGLLEDIPGVPWLEGRAVTFGAG